MRRMSQALSLITAALAVLAMHAGPAHAQKKTLVVALNQDPDLLDPTLARTYVGRIVFSHICEKLYEIGRASCREECLTQCRSRWSPYH